jgi:hypothetical protein
VLFDPELFGTVWLLIAGLVVAATTVVVGATSFLLWTALRTVGGHDWRRLIANATRQFWVHRHEDQPAHDILLDGGNYLEPPPNFPF